MGAGNSYASVHKILDLIEVLLGRIDDGFGSEDDKYLLYTELVMAENIADNHRSLLSHGLGFADPEGHKEMERRLNELRGKIKKFSDSLNQEKKKRALAAFCRTMSTNFIE